jgi:CheY-like chemotaxis protein
MKPARILVVEDNHVNQKVVTAVLRKKGYQLDIAQNGLEALQALEKSEYNLVLMDIQMPLMDGYSTTLKIRNELGMIIPIVAMTAHALVGEREKCLNYGMNEYISKPIREKELFNLIKNILEIHDGEGEVKNANNNISPDSATLNLDYLKDVSGGNTTFEINMIEQFLQQVPAELESMKEAFDKLHYEELSHIAHNLKTSVSFMGLSKTLDHYLNYIESNAVIPNLHDHIEEKMMAVINICQRAFQEAKDYLMHNASD